LLRKEKSITIPAVRRDTLGDGKGLPFIDLLYWESSEIALNARYQIVNDCWIYAGILLSDKTGTTAQLDQYTMPYYKGKKTTISVGADK
jgi:hypothetical protein